MVLSTRPVKAVLFDMTGTHNPQQQFRTGLALTANEACTNLGLGTDDGLLAALVTAFRAELSKRVGTPFYLMADVYSSTFSAALVRVGVTPTQEMIRRLVESLRGNVAASVSPQNGAIEVLRHSRTLA